LARARIDFAGGTVVHINAGIAALVGCLVIGKRVGFGKDNMAPHSMVLTMVGASMLWVGWFGFNVGSNLEANGGATLAMINTFIARRGDAGLGVLEAVQRGKASMLGAASGMVPALSPSPRPAAPSARWARSCWASVATIACYFFVTVVKHKMKLRRQP
jgi:ammonium transporter, Amt family